MIEAELAASTIAAPLIGFAALMRMIFAGKDLKLVAAELTERLQVNPKEANALLDLSTILQLRFQRDIALRIQREALKVQRLFSIPAAIQPSKIRLLVIMGACDLLSNTPVECLVEHSDIELEMLYVAHDLNFPETVPEHDVLFVAVSESDENLPLLIALAERLQNWPRPILNAPERIALLPRDCTCALLSNIHGVEIPFSMRLSRQVLREIADQKMALDHLLKPGKFPIIIRPFGSQAGRGLVKIEEANQINEYLPTVTENEFYISPFVDYRSEDGLYRKYRIVVIDGCPYICHLAISSNWLIHYLNAGMTESAEKRAEEERFFASFDSGFARRHAPALQAIYQRMGLNYLGIDCAETPTGELLIFEVDSNMIIHAFDPVEIFPYKQTQMQKVFAAFRTMLINTGGIK